MPSSLHQKRVVVTRAWHQAAPFLQKLQAHGAEVILYPCVEIVPPQDPTELDAALQKLANGGFDWLVLTSQNTVLSIKSRLDALGLTIAPGKLHVAAVGPATADAASQMLGLGHALVPAIYDAESLARTLTNMSGQAVLLPQADIAQDDLRKSLEKAGAKVHSVACYQTVKGAGGASMRDEFAKGVDAITFASPSAVQFFLERIKDEGLDANILQSTCLACIGRVTLQAAQRLGLSVEVCPKNHTIDALVLALEEHFA